MNKQTAVDLLVSILNKEGFAPVLTDEEIQQAKQLERLQIEETYNQACLDAFRDDNKYGRDYYNETYGGKDEN